MDGFKVYAGNNEILTSGTVILAPDDDALAITVQGLNYRISVVSDQAAPRIKPQRVSHNEMSIKINTWQGGDLTFRFTVGEIHTTV